MLKCLKLENKSCSWKQTIHFAPWFFFFNPISDIPFGCIHTRCTRLVLLTHGRPIALSAYDFRNASPAKARSRSGGRGLAKRKISLFNKYVRGNQRSILEILRTWWCGGLYCGLWSNCGDAERRDDRYFQGSWELQVGCNVPMTTEVASPVVLQEGHAQLCSIIWKDNQWERHW